MELNGSESHGGPDQRHLRRHLYALPNILVIDLL